MKHTLEVLHTVQSRLDDECPKYAEIIRAATTLAPPVFFASTYEDFFWHCASSIPNWLPNVVAACATTEASGAHSLLKIWRSVDFFREAEDGLLRHARDEAGHARLFVKLARLAFNDNFAPGELDKLERSLHPIERVELKKSEECISERMLLDYMMQLNIVEIRTRHHLHLLAPMYFSLTPDQNRHQVERILNGLAVDETSHVTYTAKIINDLVSEENMKWAVGIFACRLEDYNQHTLDHCDYKKYNYGQGEFPALFTS